MRTSRELPSGAGRFIRYSSRPSSRSLRRSSAIGPRAPYRQSRSNPWRSFSCTWVFACRLSAAAPFEDRLHQRHRLALDARLGRAFAALEKDDAFESLFLSGSGSTVFAIPRDLDRAEASARAALQAEGLGDRVLRARAGNAGLTITAR